jgi:Zn-dependent peptidase ImmA (M78 family)
MVSHWERGQRHASEQVLERLAQIYGVSLSALLDGQAEPLSSDLAELLYRDAEGGIDATARVGLQDFVRFLEGYIQLLETLDERFIPLRQSPFSIRKGFTGRDDIRRKAEEVRSWLRLGFAPVGDLPSVLDEAGITVYRTALGSNVKQSVSGAFLNHPQLGMCIAVNVETTPGRQIFTIAHELAHALYHSQTDGRVVSWWGRRDEKERFADIWAGEFLVPLEGLRRATESLGMKTLGDAEEVVHLQRYFGVSFGMMLLRLVQAKILDAASYERLKSTRPLAIASRLGYQVFAEEWSQDPWRWRLERFPRRFIRLLSRALREKLLSPSTAATLTGLTIDEMTELSSPPSGDSDPSLAKELEQYSDVAERVAS